MELLKTTLFVAVVVASAAATAIGLMVGGIIVETNRDPRAIVAFVSYVLAAVAIPLLLLILNRPSGLSRWQIMKRVSAVSLVFHVVLSPIALAVLPILLFLT